MNQGAVVLRPVDDGVKRLAHGADTKGDLEIRSPVSSKVPSGPDGFGQQRPVRQHRRVSHFEVEFAYFYDNYLLQNVELRLRLECYF